MKIGTESKTHHFIILQYFTATEVGNPEVGELRFYDSITNAQEGLYDIIQLGKLYCKEKIGEIYINEQIFNLSMNRGLYYYDSEDDFIEEYKGVK